MATPGGFLWQPLPLALRHQNRSPVEKYLLLISRQPAALPLGPPKGAACCLSQQNPEECP